MKIMESKLREMIRGVIREYSSGGGSSGGEPGTDKQDAESGNEPKVDTSVSLGSKYWYDSGGTSGQHGKPAKYYVPDWGGSGKAAYANDPAAKKKSPGPWTANPDYTAWEKAMADAKAEDRKATGGQGDAPTGGAAGASTGGKKGKKGKKKKDDE